MDVTSQLNLEREAGMGENTERQPAEPESAGGGGSSRAQAGGAKGPVPAPGEDKPPPSFCTARLSDSPAFRPHTQTLALSFQPHHTHVLLLPSEKQHSPKQQTKINR
ncbi:uncharacterized protein LOC112209211 [Pan troglodytes]|uniref:uncharacterized protein LOC112209211 n=1 Tax=Pan troglodytes TaxID=9598 RepID=UPI0030132005